MAESVSDSSVAADLAAMTEKLTKVVQRLRPGSRVENIVRLTGGANQQMWSFDVVGQGDALPVVFRQASSWNQGAEGIMSLENEAVLIGHAGKAGLPVPEVYEVLKPEDGLGSGYLMARISGETLPPKILRESRFATARSKLAGQCGEVLAGIHQLPVGDLGFLRKLTPAEMLEALYQEYQSYEEPRPMFELAFRWLRDHVPADPDTLALVHGDFRHGNLMVDESGLASVLDWELAFLGDPMADLGWLCVNSWRFGNIDLPVGGFGTREQLFKGYRAAGGQSPDPQRVRFWEILGTLRWGVMCQGMAASFVAGHDTSPERGAIGRRASEVEVDLLRELVPIPERRAFNAGFA